jgi:hypothetical protein
VSVRDRFQIATCDTGSFSYDAIISPVLVLVGGWMTKPPDWERREKGTFTLRVLDLAIEGEDADEAETLFDEILRTGLIQAHGDNDPKDSRKLGVLYIRQPWMWADGSIWGRFGAVIWLPEGSS